jgi:phosphate transport system permease protein
MAATLPATPHEHKRSMDRTAPQGRPPERRMVAPWADAVFSALAHIAAFITLAMLVGILLSLVMGAMPAIKEFGLSLRW